MKQIIFEGYYNENAGWEFDIPIALVHPICQFFDCHSNTGGIEDIIESYMVDLSLDNNIHEFEYKDNLIKEFRDIKIGKKSGNYWKAVVEYDESKIKTDDFDYEIIETDGWE